MGRPRKSPAEVYQTRRAASLKRWEKLSPAERQSQTAKSVAAAAARNREIAAERRAALAVLDSAKPAGENS